jgi:hypothetical protein
MVGATLGADNSDRAELRGLLVYLNSHDVMITSTGAGRQVQAVSGCANVRRYRAT